MKNIEERHRSVFPAQCRPYCAKDSRAGGVRGRVLVGEEERPDSVWGMCLRREEEAEAQKMLP